MSQIPWNQEKNVMTLLKLHMIENMMIKIIDTEIMIEIIDTHYQMTGQIRDTIIVKDITIGPMKKIGKEIEIDARIETVQIAETRMIEDLGEIILMNGRETGLMIEVMKIEEEKDIGTGIDLKHHGQIDVEMIGGMNISLLNAE